MPLTPEQIEIATRRYLAGEQFIAIAADLGVPEATLRFNVKKLGVHRPHLGHGPKPKIIGEQAQAVADAYRRGLSVNAVAAETGIPRTSVQRILDRCGVEIRPETVPVSLSEAQQDRLVEQHLAGATLVALAKKFDVDRRTAWSIVKRHGASQGTTGRPRSCTLNDAAFDVITPESARWMGFLFADGCLPKDSDGNQALAVNLAIKDRGHLEKLRAFLGSNHKIVSLRYKARAIGNNTHISPASENVFFKVRSERIANALAARGMFKDKGPMRAPTSELEDVPAFWGGAVDGDGSIGISAGYPAISLCGHMPLLEKFQAFLHRRQIADLSITPTTSGIWRIGTAGSKALAAIRMFYADDGSTPLERKMQRAQRLMRGEGIEPYEGGAR